MMARTPAVTRESVPEDQRATFDEIVQSRGGVPTSGPASVLLNAPEVAKRGLDLARFLREDTSLSPKIRELAMLVTAREKDCQFIWNAHAAHARRAGLQDGIVDNLRDKKNLPRLAPDEDAVVNYGREFFRSHRVSQATFEAALAQFGVHGLTELTNLMGCYALLAFNVNAFGVELPAERTEAPLPI
jgi:4-carboxymuconolactone decarboxylase